MEKTAQEKALEIAHDIRKFEIDLYWKRTTYFWAFIAASFTGYFAILSSVNHEFKEQYLFLIESIGFIFSLGWWLVNKGSKHWQENWEAVIGQLEHDFTGDLMKTHIKNNNKQYSLTDSYPFSVSRINQLICLFILLIWFILLTITAVEIFINYKFDASGSYLFPLTLILMLLFSYLLITIGKSKHKTNTTLDQIPFPKNK